MSVLLDLLVLFTGWTHVFLAPYTGLEESFNLHATHDVLFYGLGKEGLPYYDHQSHPGPVPTTFIGAILLAYLSKPIVLGLQWAGFELTKVDVQIIIRLVLTTMNSLALIHIRRRVSRQFGPRAGFFYTILTITQFDLPSLMGRTLPNMLALIPVNITTSLLLSASSPTLIIALLTFTTVVFRSELLLYLVPLTFQIFRSRSLSFWGIVKVGLTTGLASLALTTLVDTYFWSFHYPHVVWPELYGLHFNVWKGGCTQWCGRRWGTLPWLWYLKSLLKLLLSSLPLSILAVASPASSPSITTTTQSKSKGRASPILVTDPATPILTILRPALFYILLISLLGHKEWDFMIYVVPIFNISASLGLERLYTLRLPTVRRGLGILGMVVCLVVNLVATGMLTTASMNDYPGGVALERFTELYANHTESVRVQICSSAAHSGASIFLQTHAPPYLSSLSLLTPSLPHAPSPVNPFSPPPHPETLNPWKYDISHWNEGGIYIPWMMTEFQSLAEGLADPESTTTHLISDAPPSQFFPLLPESIRSNWRPVEPIKAFFNYDFHPVVGVFKRVLKERKVTMEDVREVVKGLKEGMKPNIFEGLWIYERVNVEQGQSDNVGYFNERGK